MLHLLAEHWVLMIMATVSFFFLFGLVVGVAFGCRTRRRRRLWFGKDHPPMNHFRPASD